jgi:hypothetical protein
MSQIVIDGANNVQIIKHLWADETVAPHQYLQMCSPVVEPGADLFDGIWPVADNDNVLTMPW